MMHRIDRRTGPLKLITVLVGLIALVYVAGFVAPSFILMADGSTSDGPACGCSEDCTCGCRCCDTDEGHGDALPSCCSAGPTHTADPNLPGWTSTCCGGGPDGDHLVCATYQPAVLAARTTGPAPLLLANCRPPAAAALATRSLAPDDPVPRRLG